MRILIAGHWQYDIYESACARSLQRLGATVIPFSLARESNSLLSRFECKYSIQGPCLGVLQGRLLTQVKMSRPDVVLIWKGTSVFPQTLQAIKQCGNIILVSYVHDDPFAHRVHSLSPRHHRLYWRLLLKGLPHYSIALFSKQLNVDDAYGFGARRSAVLRQYFVPEIHRPYTLSAGEERRFGCDVAFAGHFEPDGRDQCIRSLVKAGLQVRLYASGLWKNGSVHDLPPNFQQLPAVRGEEYAKALVGADMCLCFMSKMNRDQYTTRCFEIPACGSLLLSERTEELQELFKENEEAVFFSSAEELSEKALWLRDHPAEIERIAQGGMRRVHADGHSVDDRMKDFLGMVEQVRAEGALD